MANRPTEQPTDSWAICHITGTPAKFISIVYDQPDEEAAMKQAIRQIKVRPNDHNRLVAWQRD